MDSRSFTDMFRDPPDFTGLEPEHAKELADILNSTRYSMHACYERIFLSEFFITTLKGDLDQLARYAALAFSQAELTQDQIASLLLLIDIRKEKKTFPKFTVINFLDDRNEFTEEASKILWKLGLRTQREKDKFQIELLDKPSSERCFVNISIIDDGHERKTGLLSVAKSLNIVVKHPAEMISIEYKDQAEECGSIEEQAAQPTIQNISFLSMGAVHALAKTLYAEHAKIISPACGMLSINDVRKKMREGGRYCAIPYPGVKGPDAFHGIPAASLYLAIHDLAHYMLICSIPNPLFYALLDAIDLVSEKTGIIWTKEIWDGTDMEIKENLRTIKKYAKDSKLRPSDVYSEISKMTEHYSALFDGLLIAQALSKQRAIGLFSPSAHNDMMWLLLIDMALNRDAWTKTHIFPESMVDYKYFYSFIEKQFKENESIKTLSAAAQVAYIKSAWFGLDCSKVQEASFKKRRTIFKSKTTGEEKAVNYLQVEINEKPIYLSKKDCMLFLKIENMDMAEFLSLSEEEQNKYLQYEPLNIKQLFNIENDAASVELLLDKYASNKPKFIAFINYLTSEHCDNDSFKKIIPGMEEIDRLIDILAPDRQDPSTISSIAKDAIIKLFNRLLDSELMMHFANPDLGSLAMRIGDYAPRLMGLFISQILQKNANQEYLFTAYLGQKNFLVGCIEESILSQIKQLKVFLSTLTNESSDESLSDISSWCEGGRHFINSINGNLNQLEIILGDCSKIKEFLKTFTDTINEIAVKINDIKQVHSKIAAHTSVNTGSSIFSSAHAATSTTTTTSIEPFKRR